MATQGHGYLQNGHPLPPTFNRIVAGDSLRIGGRTFEVLSGDGHAPEQMMLYCAADKLFLAADQVLAKISPNVSVWAGRSVWRSARPLSALAEDAANAPAGGRAGAARPSTAVLRPACPQRRARPHHEERCAAIEDACRAAPRSAAELVPVIFHRPLDPHQMSFAFSEVLSHVNYMVREGRLVWTEPLNGIARVVAAA